VRGFIVRWLCEHVTVINGRAREELSPRRGRGEGSRGQPAPAEPAEPAAFEPGRAERAMPTRQRTGCFGRAASARDDAGSSLFLLPYFLSKSD
jgi:hypothetical protein